MNRTFLNTCACCAIVLGGAGSALADQIKFLGMGRSQYLNIRHDGVADNEYVGELLITKTQNGVTTPMTAFCVDLDNGALSQWSATKQPVSIIDNWASPGTALKIGFLFDTFAATADTNTKAAALQTAIWELLDDAGGVLDVRAGDFRLLGTNSTTNAVAALATTYLAAIPANLTGFVPSSYVIYSDAAPRSQHLIVPEPGSLVLLALAIPVAALRRRRQAA